MRNLVLLLIIGLFIQGCSTLGFRSDINVPDFDEETLDNGMKIVFAEDKRLPLVNLTMMVAPGASADPIGKSGLGYFTVKLIDKGAGDMSTEKLADAFAAHGTGFSGRISHDYMIFSTEFLTRSTDAILPLFHKVITSPKYTVKETRLFKKRTLASIKQSYDDPGSFADRVFAQQMMGPHPYGRQLTGSIRDVKGITIGQIKNHYQTHLRPENATLIVSGDLTDEFKETVMKTFSNWTVPLPGVSASQPSLSLKPDNRELLLVHRNDLKQSQVRIGQMGIKRSDPDYWALQVANIALGGNFSSRLMKEMRVKRGLTYGVRSSFSAGVYPGPFEVSSATPNEKVGESVTVAMDVLNEFRKKGMKKDELKRAKNFLKGHLIRAFEDPSDVVSAIVRMRLYGLSKDEITDVVGKVDSVSLDDVNEVIERRFTPDKMRIMIYGPKKSVVEQLRPVGALEVKSYKEFL